MAQLDVVCGTETGFGGSCQIIGAITNNTRTRSTTSGLDNGFGVAARQLLAARVRRDGARSRSSLIVLAVQLVSPTRRWRIRRSPRPSAASRE